VDKLYSVLDRIGQAVFEPSKEKQRKQDIGLTITMAIIVTYFAVRIIQGVL